MGAVVLLSILTGVQAFGQGAVSWDSTGDSMLSGTYYFREVLWQASAAQGGALSEAAALYGTIVFDGAGKYSITAQFLDLGGQTISQESLSGTYSIGAGGFGFLSHPLLSSGATIRGMVSNGVFIGGNTESGTYNDLFIAALIPSPTPGLSSFSGTYAMSYMNHSDVGDPSSVYYFEGAQFTLNPTGAGSLGNVSIRGFISGNGSQVTGQVSNGLKYTASSGAMVLAFPTSQSATLVYGNEYLYQSPDGNFVFGGSPQQADMLIGVRTSSGSGAQLLSSPLYYNVGVYSDATQLASGYLDLDSYYGSFSVTNGTVIQHSRIFSAVFSGTYSSVTTGTVPTTAGATYSDPYSSYTIGNGGNVRIGFGTTPYLGIDIALAAPSFSGSGVYLNPVGVLNAASYAPFTAGLSPGELIVLTGTNLASNTTIGTGDIATSAIFPNKLNNVQVLIDGIAAPLYYVSAKQIAAIVPYEASQLSIATVQVKNNGTASNTVTEFLNTTTPGVLTSPANGISDAAALHSDYSLVTESNPAQPGETISVYLTGLGAVLPLIQDGFPGSSDPSSLNNTVQTITASVDNPTSGTSSPATVLYSGLAPGYAGLYQLNITLPSTGLTAGDNYLTIMGPDSDASEALIPIGSGTSPNLSPARTDVQDSESYKSTKRRYTRPFKRNVVVKSVNP